MSRSKSFRLFTGLCGLFSLSAVINLLGLWIYTLNNGSGHTGLNPYLCLVLFVPCLLSGLGLAAIDRRPPIARRLSRLSISLGAFGVLFLIYLDMTNTLLPYEVWLQRGMP